MQTTKHGAIWLYQPNDYVYHGRDNKIYFDRGSYARPWPKGYLHEGYVSTPDSSLGFNVIECGTGAPLAFTSGFTLISTDINGVKTFRWWIQLTASASIRSYFIEVLSNTGGVVKRKFIYSGNALATNDFFNFNFVERGILVRLQENAILSRITIPVNIILLANPIQIKVYKVNPHNLKDVTLLVTYNNNTYVGQVGNVDMVLNIDSNALAATGWNAGDLVIISILLNPADSVTTNYRAVTDGISDPNAYYWDANNGFNSLAMFPTWRVEAYDALYSELLVESNDPLLMIKYKNNRVFDLVPANTEQVTYIRGNFWQPSYPAEFEDVEILPAQFTRVRNELHRTRMLETDYITGYRHEHIQHVLACDIVNIDGTEVIQRDTYEMPFSNRQYGLAKGKVVLTEKKSIIRNIV
jgi:hypothetical protein